MQLLRSRISHPAGHDPNAASGITDQKPIKNIIFDFGGVICNIDVKIAEKNFVSLGVKINDPLYPVARSNRVFEDLETGILSPQQFRNSIRPFFEPRPSDRQIDDAWNSLLLDIPEPRIRLIEKVSKEYRIFMLTNTNEIHYLQYRAAFSEQFGYHDFDDLFEKAYYSYRIGMKKPDVGIFRHVLNDRALDPAETLFIDDTLMHVEGANAAGIHAHHLLIGGGEQILDLFS